MTPILRFRWTFRPATSGSRDIDTAGRSPLYADVARAVARDDDVIALPRRDAAGEAPAQPAVRRRPLPLRHAGDGAREFIELIHAHPDEIGAVMAARSTQTNEPARCATLLPLLARLPQPLALLEVGASGGLCLLPDRYGYDYGRRRIAPPTPEAPVFARAGGRRLRFPERTVEVVPGARGSTSARSTSARADEVAWLEALVWPGEEYRIPLPARGDRGRPPRPRPGSSAGDLLHRPAGARRRGAARRHARRLPHRRAHVRQRRGRPRALRRRGGGARRDLDRERVPAPHPGRARGGRPRARAHGRVPDVRRRPPDRVGGRPRHLDRVALAPPSACRPSARRRRPRPPSSRA